MNYNSYHTGSMTPGMSRDQGFNSRGSFRGQGDNSGSWSSNDTGRGRGGFTAPSQGRFNWYTKDTSSGFESNNRYSSAGAGNAGGDRYATAGRGRGDTGYRYGRGDMPDYSSQDHSQQRSPESQRKRMRTDHGYVQGSATHRSQEGSYGGGTNYNRRYSSYEDKGSYGDDRGSGYRGEKQSTGSFRDRSREDFPHRKVQQMGSSMPPPSGMPKHLSTPRGSFRGRISRGTRGMSRIILPRRSEAYLTRKRISVGSSNVHKQIIRPRTRAETLRQSKIQRLRRLRQVVKTEKEDKENDTKEVEDNSDDDVDEETGSQDSDNGVADEEISKELLDSIEKPLELSCPHCFTHCTSDEEYEAHLDEDSHILAMRTLSRKTKEKLSRLRMNQRERQNLLEEAEEGYLSPAIGSLFCSLCKLKYRQHKTKHLISEHHVAMVKFLKPTCRTCRQSFMAPMLYENHICSLEHVKRKALLRESKAITKSAAEGIVVKDEELNEDNLMVLDSVEGDDGAEKDEEKKEKEVKDKAESVVKKKPVVKVGSEYVKKVEVYFCELCQMYLPRLKEQEKALAIHCRQRAHVQQYVKFRNDKARDEKALKKEAGKLRKDKKSNSETNEESKTDADDKEKMDEDEVDNEAEKDSEGKSKNKEQDESKDDEEIANGDVAPEESGMDDKLWEDVDKDLGELLSQVEPGGNKSSDEDNDSQAGGRRYDRFRHSEKGNVTDLPSEGDATDMRSSTDIKDNENESDSKTEG